MYLIFSGARIAYLTILSIDLIACYMSYLAMTMLVIICNNSHDKLTKRVIRSIWILTVPKYTLF